MTLFGPCAKRRTQAVLTTRDGELFVAENVCLNPQPVCPRAPGEGYEKCQSICRQVGHAEELVVEAAGDKATDAVVEITHWYACDECLKKLKQAGVCGIVFRSPVDSERTL